MKTAWKSLFRVMSSISCGILNRFWCLMEASLVVVLLKAILAAFGTIAAVSIMGDVFGLSSQIGYGGATKKLRYRDNCSQVVSDSMALNLQC